MAEVSIYLLAFAAAVAGCLSTDRHHRDVFGFEPSAGRRGALRLGAWMLLAASWGIAVALEGPGIGSVEWVCAAGLGSVALILLRPYKPRWVPYLGATAACSGIALVLISQQ